MTKGRYRTIVADPPWHYDLSSVYVAEREQSTKRALAYPTMTVEEIAEMPVAGMAERDAHLYLWTTQRYLAVAHDVVKAWGFGAPSAVLVWCKPPRGFVGTFACSTEFALFCRRGCLPAKQKWGRNWFEWPRGAHSAKPEAFMDIVEQVSPGPYLELFSRRARLGWDTWGNESLHGGEAA